VEESREFLEKSCRLQSAVQKNSFDCNVHYYHGSDSSNFED
jgi:hypothetical protein